jgi:hypothetical protein
MGAVTRPPGDQDHPGREWLSVRDGDDGADALAATADVDRELLGLGGDPLVR